MMHAQMRRHGERNGFPGGIVLVVLGGFFLLREVFKVDLDLGRYGWPLFIIGPGLLLFAAMVAGRRGAGSLAVPASVVTTIGLMLFAQNVTGYYQSWAYSWALIPVAAGVGLMIGGAWDGRPDRVREGRSVAAGGLVMLAAFTTLFEVFIYRSSALVVYLLPLGMIVGGALLVARNLGRREREPFLGESEETATAATAEDEAAQEFWPM